MTLKNSINNKYHRASKLYFLINNGQLYNSSILRENLTKAQYQTIINQTSNYVKHHHFLAGTKIVTTINNTTNLNYLSTVDDHEDSHFGEIAQSIKLEEPRFQFTVTSQDMNPNIPTDCELEMILSADGLIKTIYNSSNPLEAVDLLKTAFNNDYMAFPFICLSNNNIIRAFKPITSEIPLAVEDDSHIRDENNEYVNMLNELDDIVKAYKPLAEAISILYIITGELPIQVQDNIAKLKPFLHVNSGNQYASDKMIELFLSIISLIINELELTKQELLEIEKDFTEWVLNH